MTPRKTGTPLLDQLAEYGRAIARAKQRHREIDLERAAVERDAERLHGERIAALSADDVDRAAQLQTERAEAEQAARDLADRVAAAKLAVDQATAGRQQFAADNLAGLLAEHRPGAEAAVEAIHDALDRLAGAHTQWRQAEARTIELLGLAGRGQERTPVFPGDLSDLLRDLARSPTDVPLPLPRLPMFAAA